MTDEKLVIGFGSARNFEQWLARHQGAHEGIWMRIIKKGAETSAQRLEEFIASKSRGRGGFS